MTPPRWPLGPDSAHAVSPADSWRAWHFNLPWESSPLSQAGMPVWAAIDYYKGPWATRAPRGAAPLADGRRKGKR